jgi:hypothetical protein
MRRTAVATLALSLLLAVPARHAGAQFIAHTQSYVGCSRFGCTTALVQIMWDDVSDWKAGNPGRMWLTFRDVFHPFDGQSAMTVERAIPGDIETDPEGWFDANTWPNSVCFGTVPLPTGPTTCDDYAFSVGVSRWFGVPDVLMTTAVTGPVGAGNADDLLAVYDGGSVPLPPPFAYESVILNAVPEPTALLLVGTGLAGLLGVWRRRRA